MPPDANAAPSKTSTAPRGELLRSSVVVAVLLASTSGCAIGVKHDYGRASPTIHAGPGPFAVAVNDQRPYVLSGDSDPSYVGMQRAGYGNPFDVNTVSGLPLKEEFAVAIRNGLGESRTDTVPLRPGISEVRAIDALAATRASRLVLLTLHDWQSDTYNNTSLYYDVSLDVFDGNAAPLASERFKGEDDLGGSFMNPPSHARATIPTAFESNLETFFASPPIRTALAGNGAAEAQAAPPKSRSGAPPGTSRPAAARLEELESLRKAGLVSEGEYRRKREAILEDL